MATITFIRHGNTNKAATDMERALTEQGVKQAQERRSALNNPEFDLVISSIAPRAIHTAEIVAGRKVDVTLEQLYLGNEAQKAIIDQMVKKLGRATLRMYHKEEGGKLVLSAYGADAVAAILKAVIERGAKTVLVVGHAIFLPQVTYSMGAGSEILDLAMEECETITVEV